MNQPRIPYWYTSLVCLLIVVGHGRAEAVDLFDESVTIGIATVVQLDTIHDFNAVGLDPSGGFEKEFITGDIPVSGTLASRRRNRTGLSPNQSSWVFWASKPTPYGEVKVYSNFNLTKSVVDTEFQLYRAYGMWGGLKAGFDRTLWLNQDTIPSTLDFEGPGVIPENRFAQVSYRLTVGGSSDRSPWYLLMGLEDAPADMTLPNHVINATSVDQVPALIGKLGFQPDWAHIEFAGMWRQLKAIGDLDYSSQVQSWGLMFDGTVQILGEDNFIFGALCGEGLGNYIDDTGGSGLDAAPISSADPQLRTIPAYGYWFAYQHMWNDLWRSTATYGYVRLDNEFYEPPTPPTYPYGMTHASQYVSANLIWAPRSGFEVGLEYLFGWREVTENTVPVDGRGTTGWDHRLQFTVRWYYAGKHTSSGHQPLEKDQRRSPRFF